MSIATVITRGFGTFGSVADIIRRGFDAAAQLISPDCVQEVVSTMTDATEALSSLSATTETLSSLSDTNITLGVLCS